MRNGTTFVCIATTTVFLSACQSENTSPSTGSTHQAATVAAHLFEVRQVYVSADNRYDLGYPGYNVGGQPQYFSFGMTAGGGAGQHAVYHCRVGSGPETKVSTAADCGGDAVMDRIGFLYDSGGSGRTALYQCVDPSTGHFLSNESNCGGATVAGLIGYTSTFSEGMYRVARTTTGRTSVFDAPATTVMRSSNVNYDFVGDFNGDGKSDMLVWNYETTSTTGNSASTSRFVLYLSTGTGWQAPIVTIAKRNKDNAPGHKIGDFNGDGKADLLVWNKKTTTTTDSAVNTSRYNLYLSNGAGLSTPIVTIAGSKNTAYDRVGDFNGDGKADLLIWHKANQTTTDSPSGTNRYNLYLSNGAGFDPPITTIARVNSTNGDKVGDVNGDGKADLLIWNYSNQTTTDSTVNTNRYNLYLSNGAGFNAPITTIAKSKNVAGDHLADFDGDGRDDLMIWHYKNQTTTDSPVGTNRYNLYLSSGAGFDAPVTTIASSKNVALDKVADFNGDGQADMAIWHYLTQTTSDNPVGTNRYNVYPSAGTALGAGSQTIATATGWDFAADINGDGSADLLVWNRLTQTLDDGYTQPSRYVAYRAGGLAVVRDVSYPGYAPAGQPEDGMSFIALVSPAAGTHAIYNCSYLPNGDGARFLSTSSTCEGRYVLSGLVGYLWDQPASDRRPLYRCKNGPGLSSNTSVSTDPNCESWPYNDGILGYTTLDNNTLGIPTERFLAIGDSMTAASNADDFCGKGGEIPECMEQYTGENGKGKMFKNDVAWSFATSPSSWSLASRLRYDAEDVINAGYFGTEWWRWARYKPLGDPGPTLLQTALPPGNPYNVRAVSLNLGANDICQFSGFDYEQRKLEIVDDIDTVLGYLTAQLPAGGAIYLSAPPDIEKLYYLMKNADHYLYADCSDLWELRHDHLSTKGEKSICKWMGFGDTFCNAATDYAEGVLAWIIEYALTIYGEEAGLTEWPCATMLGTSDTDRANAIAFQSWLIAKIQERAQAFDGVNGVAIYFTDVLQQATFSRYHVSRLDCFHPSRSGQIHMADTLATGFANQGAPMSSNSNYEVMFTDFSESNYWCGNSGDRAFASCWWDEGKNCGRDGGAESGFNIYEDGGWFKVAKASSNERERVVQRKFGDLSNKQHVFLSFLHRRRKVDDSGDWVKVKVYDKKTNSWVQIDKFRGGGTDAGRHNGKMYDLTPYISDDMRICLEPQNAGSMENDDGVLFDDVQVVSW